MPNLIDIRRRIRSVKSTQQITKAMKMVAAARMRRAQDRVLATRPYATELQKVIASVAGKSGDQAKHPLLVERPAARVLLVVVTGDKGLCGGFNTNVLRAAQKTYTRLAAESQVQLLLLGKKGVDTYRRRGNVDVRAAYTSIFTGVTYAQADEIAKDIVSAYGAGELDAVHIVYNAFRSIITQELTVERLLPIPTPAASEAAAGPDYLYEPKAVDILADLLPRYISFQLYRILLESQAAEHAARMTAMDSATKNAKELIESLSMTYNRARQAAITKELIEVVSGASAAEG
jgi:F-type H+-transporting ATPase subunit gamma